MVQDTFRSFADKIIAPRAEHVHRTNADVPEEIISGLAEMGAFGLSVPSEFGGFSEGGEGSEGVLDHLEVVVQMARTGEIGQAGQELRIPVGGDEIHHRFEWRAPETPLGLAAQQLRGQFVSHVGGVSAGDQTLDVALGAVVQQRPSRFHRRSGVGQVVGHDLMTVGTAVGRQMPKSLADGSGCEVDDLGGGLEIGGDGGSGRHGPNATEGGPGEGKPDSEIR
ncbi:MAG: acyl-CoA dehydrogenase family protein [Actinomycetota bacterium]